MLMLQTQEPVVCPKDRSCSAVVATSPYGNRELLFAILPTKPALLRGEQTSCNNSPQLSGCASVEGLGCSSAVPAAAEVTQAPPLWLEGLFTSDLFNPCPRHSNVRKNECNFYCLTCTAGQRRGMCKYCLGDHTECGGQVFQIRKYMYQTCVHVEDLQHLYDCSGIQAYCINGKRAVLIHPKVMAPGQQCPVFDNTCRGCDKPLRSDCLYCSLKCKVDLQYGRAPRTPQATGLAAHPRAHMTATPPSAANSDASARSCTTHWVAAGRIKKRKNEQPYRSYVG